MAKMKEFDVTIIKGTFYHGKIEAKSVEELKEKIKHHPDIVVEQMYNFSMNSYTISSEIKELIARPLR